VQIADPYLSEEVTTKNKKGEDVTSTRRKVIRKEQVTIEIDGQPIEVKEGYNGVYPYIPRSCMGLYAEITNLAPGVKHAIKVTLPDGLAPGQFQGLFFEHVEDEFTTVLAPARTK
jgi:hypothetical protein